MNKLITTAISYTNGDPHIGHLYEIILADFIKKIFELKYSKETVKLLTGTDEHGKKIEESAKLNNIGTKEFCDINSKKFRDLYDKCNIDYDYFIRTTDDNHKELVKDSLIKSFNNCDIYLDTYEGWYNIREENFVSELEAKETDFIDPISNKPYEKIKEESYYFKLSKYKDFIQDNLKIVVPLIDNFNNRLENLKDLSISRTSFKWGIEFPFNSNHITYVWFDALLNYVTGAKKLGSKHEIYHLIGKDILWFHSVIYPAILKSCKYEDFLPKKILVHGFVLDKNRQKMSKSLGNVIDVNYLLNKFNEESVRFYFLKNTKLGEDFVFNEDILINDYNNILLKDYGNLIQRIHKLSIDIIFEINSKFSEKEKSFITIYDKILDDFILDIDISKYFENVFNIIKECNKDISEQEPWKKNKEERCEIITELLIKVKYINKLLYPIIPQKIREIENIFDFGKNLNISTNKIKVFLPIK
jgi:methionyl-tRNA synthetase